jgi:hypothetical protein
MEPTQLLVIFVVLAVMMEIIVVVAEFVIPALAAGRGFPGCGNTAGFNASQGHCFHP